MVVGPERALEPPQQSVVRTTIVLGRIIDETYLKHATVCEDIETGDLALGHGGRGQCVEERLFVGFDTNADIHTGEALQQEKLL